MTMPSGNGAKREPIECHDKCPECGCEERLVANFVAELKEKGVISQESFPKGAGVWELPFLDLKKVSLIQTPEPIKIFPTLRILWDICAECHKVYILSVETGEKGMLQQQAVPRQVNKV